jgi:lipoyl-dependent peroxiredoxin
MKILRRAGATWLGTVPAGSGRMRLGRDGAEFPFSLRTRTEDVPGTNPEELLGAAHAGCFSMSLSNVLEEAGHPSTAIRTEATVVLEPTGGGFSVTRVDLVTRGEVPGLDQDAFAAYAEQAKATCTVSRLFASAEITLQASLD